MAYVLLHWTVHSAPELLFGGYYGAAVDAWSVGCVLFECVTGKRLFEGTRLYASRRWATGLERCLVEYIAH